MLTLVQQEEGWSKAETGRQIGAFGDVAASKKIADRQHADFVMDDKTAAKALDGGPVDAHFEWAIYLWARAKYSKDLADRCTEEEMRQQEPLIAAFTDFWGVKSLSADLVRSAAGEYEMYRPFYKDPHSKILVSRFSVGGASMFRCEMRADASDIGKDVPRDRFHGKLIPHGERLMAVLRSPMRISSSIIIHFDQIVCEHSDELITAMDGVMLTAIGYGPSSAWPACWRRVESAEHAHPRLIEKADWGNLDESILDALGRGTVHWNPRHNSSFKRAAGS